MGLLSVRFRRRLLYYDRLSLWDSDLVAFSKMAYQPGLMILAVGWVGVTIAGPSNQLLCGPLHEKLLTCTIMSISFLQIPLSIRA